MDILFAYFPLININSAWLLVIGFLFGYFLEVAGLGSPRKLTAQFRFSDWTVFKTMFTAIVVAAVGLVLLGALEWLTLDLVYIPTAHYFSLLTGGALLGAGLAIGGYCPGTSVVGLFSGRLDGLFFIGGMISGILLFAFTYSWVSPIFSTHSSLSRQTLPEVLELPVWLVLIFLMVLALAGFLLGSWLEKRSGGPLSAQSIEDGSELR